MIKDILARIYCFYLVIVFILTMLPVAFTFWIARTFFDEQKASKIIQNGFQVWMGIYMPLIFCPVKHKGREHFKKGQNYVVTMNHNSLFDVPVSTPGIPTANRTLAKIEMSRIPIFGYIYSSGSILLDREDLKSRTESFKKMVAALEKGYHLGLFPEGTRNKTSQPIARFFDGAFRVAIMAQKPIIPALIFGTKNILHPSKKFWAWPHKIEFHFLPEINIEGLQPNDADRLKQKVFAIMNEYFIANKHLI